MDLRVLGALTIEDGRIAPAPRDRLVLGALAVSMATSVSVESLATALWGEDLPPSWSRVIPGCIMRLRRLIAPARIETTPTGYRLERDGVDLDATRFEGLVMRGSQLLELGEPDRAAHALSQALALWRGQPFAELPDWEPAQIASYRLEEIRLGAEESLLEARLQSGDLLDAAAQARARVAEAPMRERRWVILGLAQYRQGRQADALATVRRGRELLAAELGLDPCVELAALEKAILGQDPSLLADRVFRAGSPECPYFGLPPAGVADAEWYFGREQELSGAVAALERRGVLLVGGSSGVGKSSFVRAGIGAQFIARGVPVAIVTPGEHPLQALADIDLPAGQSLLIVDQCEQAFAADDPAEIRGFFDALSQRVFQGMLVIAIRADRLGDLADQQGFAEIIQSHLLMLTAFGTDGLRSVIEKPAEQAGLILEPGLVEILVRDADGRSLPLLSHALRQVWSRREGRVMTVDGYRASGEIEGAIAKTAEEVLAALSAEGGRMLRDILLRLVEASGGGAILSRRVQRTRIAIDDAHAKVIERLVDARLLTTDEDSVQLSHEALTREWPRLKEWLADDVEGQRIMRHLGAAAAAWDAMERPDTELYRGGRLTAARNWRDADHPALTAVEQEFLDASHASETARLEATQKQLFKERRMVRRLTWLSAGAAGLAIIAVVAGLFGVYQSNLAETRNAVSEARRMAALALEESDLDRALLLAVEAIHLWDDPEMRVNLLRVIARAPRMVSITRVPETGVSVSSMSLAHDGMRASVIDSDDDMRLFDLEARSQLGEYAPFANAVVASAVDPASGEVAFSEVGRFCRDALCDFQRTGAIDLAGGGGTGVTTFEGMPRMAADVEYSADGSLFTAIAPIPASPAPANVALWRTNPEGRVAPVLLDLESLGTAPAGVPDPSRQFGTVKFSPDGSLLYASGFGPTFVFDTATGEKISQIEGDGVLAVSPDGRRVAVRDGVLSARIVDTRGAAEPTVIAVSSFPDAADFSPDGARLAIADGTRVIVSDVETGATTETLQVGYGDVIAVEFRPSGELVTATTGGAIITWDVGDWSSDFRTTRSVRALALASEDERTLSFEQVDGMTEVVVAEPAAWEFRACQVAGRMLSGQEWIELFGDRPYTPACRG